MGPKRNSLPASGSATRLDYSVSIGIAVLGLIAIGLCSMKGISLTPPLWALAAPAGGLLAVSLYYARVRPDETTIVQILTYTALWILFPLIAVRLSYVGAALKFDLRDDLFTAADATMGADWISVARFIKSHPALDLLAHLAYGTSYYQPMVIVVVLAFWGRSTDNAKLMIAMTVALLITLVPHTLWPSIGPAPRYGFATAWEAIWTSLREGDRQHLKHVGIVTFPSYHATMAVLFTLAYRNVPTMAVVAALMNLLMLLSIPYPGGHYLIDLPAGVVIGLIGYWFANMIVARHSARQNALIQAGGVVAAVFHERTRNGAVIRAALDGDEPVLPPERFDDPDQEGGLKRSGRINKIFP